MEIYIAVHISHGHETYIYIDIYIYIYYTSTLRYIQCGKSAITSTLYCWYQLLVSLIFA